MPALCAARNVAAVVRAIGLRGSDRVVLLSPCSFDPSVVELFGTWSVGAHLIVWRRSCNSEVYCNQSFIAGAALSVIRSPRRCVMPCCGQPTVMLALRHCCVTSPSACFCSFLRLVACADASLCVVCSGTGLCAELRAFDSVGRRGVSVVDGAAIADCTI